MAVFSEDGHKLTRWEQPIEYSGGDVPGWAYVTFASPVEVGPEPFFLALTWPYTVAASPRGVINVMASRRALTR